MKRDIHNSLGYNINVVSHFLQNSYNEKLSRYGLTNSQAKVIYFLATSGDQTQTDLQNKLYIKASSMNGIIESLLKHERIVKQPSEHDKRTNVISLTNNGLELYGLIWEIIQEMEQELSQGLSHEEQKLMISWLQKMRNNL